MGPPIGITAPNALILGGKAKMAKINRFLFGGGEDEEKYFERTNSCK
jgi:hypothetical protein